MIRSYRGFEVHAHREQCMAGYKLLYFHAVRICDGLIITDGFTEGSDTVGTYIAIMKNHIDNFILSQGKSHDMEDEWIPKEGVWIDTKQRLTGKWSEIWSDN